jgi:hypothetical protein
MFESLLSQIWKKCLLKAAGESVPSENLSALKNGSFLDTVRLDEVFDHTAMGWIMNRFRRLQPRISMTPSP